MTVLFLVVFGVGLAIAWTFACRLPAYERQSSQLVTTPIGLPTSGVGAGTYFALTSKTCIR
jgi:ABC-type molybdate transport system permease subunit